MREATTDDLPAILEMAEQFVSVLAIGVPFDAQSCIQTALDLIESDRGVIFIGEGGMLGGIVYPHFFNRSVLMAQELFWWISPDKRGLGLGRELWESFEAWAKDKGAQNVTMIALANQKPVGRLYERRGYVPMESTWVKTWQ